jgi:dTDP-4-amino-4,6-dideoxygalactose transaminase
MIDQNDIEAVVQILSSENIAQGVKVREFEQQVARFVGTKYAVACSSGTSALHLAMIGLGLNDNDEVIIPSYVCASPYFAALHAHLKPKIVDINRLDSNISLETAKKGLSRKTKAIIVPHMFGNPAELEELLELQIPLIEDCAQSLGAEYKNRRVGSFGAASVLSFYATKMITTGEGGMILTNNRMDYSRIIEARDYDKKALSPPKYNYKMTDFQAALGLSQLEKLQYFVERRRKIASLYNERFSDCEIQRPQEHIHKKPVYFRYVIMTSDANKTERQAKEKGVTCEKPVWKPIHQDLNRCVCPSADYVHKHSLSIPLYPSLTKEEIEYVVRTMERIFKKK